MVPLSFDVQDVVLRDHAYFCPYAPLPAGSRPLRLDCIVPWPPLSCAMTTLSQHMRSPTGGALSTPGPFLLLQHSSLLISLFSLRRNQPRRPIIPSFLLPADCLVFPLLFIPCSLAIAPPRRFWVCLSPPLQQLRSIPNAQTQLEQRPPAHTLVEKRRGLRGRRVRLQTTWELGDIDG